MKTIQNIMCFELRSLAPTVFFLVHCEAGGDTFFSSFHYEKNTQNDSGGDAVAFTYIYIKSRPAMAAPERPAPHDLSASQSEAARSECVVHDEATQHDLLSSGGNKVWFTTIPPDMEASCSTDQQNGYDCRYTFSAKEKDDETQYSYFGARYYDSDLSVWLTVDPYAFIYPMISPYSYCANNPIMLIDPNGNWIERNITRYKNGRNLSKISNSNNYFANGILVHNESK